MSSVPLGSSKGDSEVFISEECFEVEVPTGASKPPLKKIKEEPSAFLSYSEWEKESWKKEAEKGELYLCAEPKDPFAPRPKAVAIRYRKRSQVPLLVKILLLFKKKGKMMNSMVKFTQHKLFSKECLLSFHKNKF